jgi:hypothetical protein
LRELYECHERPCLWDNSASAWRPAPSA